MKFHFLCYLLVIYPPAIVTSIIDALDPRYGTRKFAPTEVYKTPLSSILGRYLKNETTFAEITSGTGRLILYLAKDYPHVTFMPTSHDGLTMPSLLRNINYHTGHNLLQPLYLDVLNTPVHKWFDFKVKRETLDYIFNSHLINLAPPECYKVLFQGSGHYLKRRGLLFLFGAFKHFGNAFPQCNVEFDKTLRETNPLWGLRDIDLELVNEAEKNDLYLVVMHSFPFPYQLLVFKKGSPLLL